MRHRAVSDLSDVARGEGLLPSDARNAYPGPGRTSTTGRGHVDRVRQSQCAAAGCGDAAVSVCCHLRLHG